MKMNKLFLRWIAVFGMVMMFAVSGWGVVLDTDTFNTDKDGWDGSGEFWDTSQRLFINRDQTGTKTFTFAAYPNQVVTVSLVATKTATWENSDLINITANGTSVYNSNTDGTISFNATLNGSGQLALVVTPNTNNDNEDLYIDNISITYTPTPEINVVGIADGGTDTSFGSTLVTGGTIDKSYTIQNTGTETLSITDVTFSGGNSGDFSVVTSPASSVAAGGSTTFTVRFDPSAVGNRTTTLNIANNDSNENPYNYSIEGTGIVPNLSISNASLVEGDSGVSYMNFTVTLSSSANVSINYATSDGTATAASDYTGTSGTLTFTAGGVTTQSISVPIIGDTLLEGDETFTVTLSNATGGAIIGTATAAGSILNDDTYCKSNSLSTGFHIIDPDGGSDKNSFEIFCSADTPKKDLIALPNKNSSNNFIFNSDTLGSTNYYAQATSNSTSFNAIEINPLTMQVLTSGSLNPTNAGSYNVMGKGFSNINLLGTPFAIDWSNTTISGCDTAKLTRKGYHGQVVKINALDYNNKARCQIDSMKLKLLSDYTYLTYDNAEVLEKSCKLMAEAVPTDVLDSASVKGHYWISPNNNSRSHNSTTITALDRPIVAYCWYQTDLNYVWTFFLAMDGKVTNTKSDLVNKADTCSEKGIWPFVPNNESTFERVRQFLYDNKSEWANYTGTIEEKMQTFVGSSYYLAKERPSPIWPYGSFGVYYPGPGTSFKWGGEDFGETTKQTGPMSGSPMHNISTITEDYPRKNDDTNGGATPILTRDYYSWGNYSDTDTSGGGNYAYTDTMGAKGWLSILGSQDLNKTNDWFISRTGAGQNFDSSDTQYPYYEPNGNYTAGAWLNYLFDDQGRVRHNDDLSDKYAYYDYMCMAEDNYDFTTRYGLVKGPFNVVEHNAVLSGTGYRDATLSTKIAKDTMRFDVVLLKDDLSNIRGDAEDKRSYGLFLDDIQVVGSGEIPHDLYYFGDHENNFQSLGTRFELTAPYWGGTETWPKASKRLFFNFKYCSQTNMKWTDCWTLSGNTATCKAGSESYCKTANSNDFAVRPKAFGTELLTSPLKAGVNFSLNMKALNYLDGNTTDYNESVGGSFDVIVQEAKSGCIKGTLKNDLGSSWKFSNGAKAFVDNNYSEVGALDINMTEAMKPCQSRFASIDCNDTALNVLSIADHHTQLVFTPDHFKVSAKFFNVNNGKFTYLSNPYATSTKDFSMSGRLDLNITAKNAFDGNTTNYNASCYAKAKDIHLTYTPTTITNLNTLYTQYLHDSTVIGDINHTNGTSLSILDVPKDIFTVDHKSMAILHLNLNFDRNHTATVNKFDFNSSQIQVNTADEVNATVTPTGGVTFVYGRFAPRDVRVFGSKPFTASGWYEVYNAPILSSTILPPSKNTALWYTNTLHNDDIHGNANVTFVLPNTMAVPANSDMLDPPLGAGMETYTFGGGVVPYSGKAHVDINPWLWFGEAALGYADPGTNVDGTVDALIDDADCLHHPCFNINVVPDIGRAGSATGTELRSDKANKATRTKGVHYDYTPATR